MVQQRNVPDAETPVGGDENGERKNGRAVDYHARDGGNKDLAAKHQFVD